MLIQQQWQAFNTRRYGNPWAARVTFEGVKPKFDFIGRYSSGVLAFEANPNEIVALGQKDHRGNDTTKEYYIVQKDAQLLGVSENEALLHWRAHPAYKIEVLLEERARLEARLAEIAALLS